MLQYISLSSVLPGGQEASAGAAWLTHSSLILFFLVNTWPLPGPHLAALAKVPPWAITKFTLIVLNGRAERTCSEYSSVHLAGCTSVLLLKYSLLNAGFLHGSFTLVKDLSTTSESVFHLVAHECILKGEVHGCLIHILYVHHDLFHAGGALCTSVRQLGLKTTSLRRKVIKSVELESSDLSRPL